jgi:hypothetical protein
MRFGCFFFGPRGCFQNAASLMLAEFVCEPVLWIPSDHLTLSIATVIGRGKVNWRTMVKARKIASMVSASASIAELMNSGLTEKQAVLLAASIHIGQELCSAPLKVGEKYNNSREIFQRYRARFYSVRKEYFVALNLNLKKSAHPGGCDFRGGLEYIGRSSSGGVGPSSP